MVLQPSTPAGSAVSTGTQLDAKGMKAGQLQQDGAVMYICRHQCCNSRDYHTCNAAEVCYKQPPRPAWVFMYYVGGAGDVGNSQSCG